jgi:hypothetical protein
MLKLDIDHIYRRPRLSLQRVMYAMPRPFSVRLSSSRAGLHIKVSGCAEWDWRRCYDDPMRVALDDQRRRRGLPVHNLLWDVKQGKLAGPWREIQTERDIEGFLDTFTNTYIYHVPKHTDWYDSTNIIFPDAGDCRV